MSGCCELCGCCCMDDLTPEEREKSECVGGYDAYDEEDD